jgi:hypothetical protein
VRVQRAKALGNSSERIALDPARVAHAHDTKLTA